MRTVHSPRTRLARVLALASVVAMILSLAPAISAATPPDRLESTSTAAADLDAAMREGVTPLPSMEAEGTTLIRILAGAFDPLTDSLPTVDGVSLVDASTLPASPDYFLVQVAAGDFASATAAIDSNGGLVAGFMPDDTYIVRATPAQATSIASSSAVRWVGYYQPAWRIPVAVGDKVGLLDLDGTQRYKVYVFRAEPNIEAVGDALTAIDGATVVEHANAVYVVEATAAQVPAMAAISGVEWIGVEGEIVLHNANARWVNDTGVRDTYEVTAPGRLTGAGQTAAIADTGVNYTYDINGRAHIGFRDCNPDGTGCKEAQYTQVTPGNSPAAVNNTQAHGTNHRKVVAYFDMGNTGPNMYDTSSHGTHTSGSVVSDQGNNGVWDGHDGIAPGAMHVHQNIASSTGGLVIPADSYLLWRQAYRPRDPQSVPTNSPANGNVADYANYVPEEDARTHNNSYGLTIPIIDLGDAFALDQFIWDHEDMVVVVSAGNAGPDPLSSSQPAVAKNNMTSGASANGRQPMASIDSMAIFSSHGPTADGRLGTDLATPGQIVISPKGGSVDEYHVAQGTSMSAPILTGLATLVRQYFYDGFGPADGSGFGAGVASAARSHNPSAALVRATMINGAERMRGFYTGDIGSNSAQNGQWPSAGQGFGQVNLANSLYFPGDVASTWYHDVWRADADAFGPSGPLAEVREYTIDVAAGHPLDVTLAYTDAPGALPAGTPVITNNLDLRVVDPTGLVFYVGNNMNTRAAPALDVHETLPGPGPADQLNPVERVRVANPMAGEWTIQVIASNVAIGNQGFALAASGLLGDGYTPGPGLFSDAPGAPTISNVVVEATSGDTAVVTFDTSEPTTATATVGGQTYIDSYAVSDFVGLNESTSETSAAFADKPMVGTSHEILLTGLSHGTSISIDLEVTDLADNTGTHSEPFSTPGNVYQADAPDIAQLVAGAGTTSWGTSTQMYAGRNAGPGYGGGWMFRGITTDPADVIGASVEFTSAHDWVVKYNQDPVLTMDLLDDSVEGAGNWGTPAYGYDQIAAAPADARAFPETTHLRGAHQLYSFAFTCNDLDALRTNIADGNAAFRLLSTDFSGVGLFSAEVGFNRRSNGPDLRPRLVLHTADSGHPNAQNCDPNAPAPTISNVGVKPGLIANSTTVSWETDRDSSSIVLFREVGTTDWTQVGTAALTKVHHVQVQGLTPGTEYEFVVHSAGCNGLGRTDTNAGRAYSMTIPASAPTSGPVPADPGGHTDLAPPTVRSGAPNAADLAAGTAWCEVPSFQEALATDDTYMTTEEAQLVVAAPGVLGNDTGATSATLVDDVSNGTLALSPDGSFTYDPDPDFFGVDTFTYEASNGTDTGMATVSIIVANVNDAPVAADDAYTTGQQVTLEVAAPGVLGNDVDADGDALTASLVSGPSNGSLALNDDGSFEYSANPGFFGIDSFVYSAGDGTLSSEATVEITVEEQCFTDAGNYSDDFESGAPGWTVDNAVLSAPAQSWELTVDPAATSPVTVWFVEAPLTQGGLPATSKDVRLVSPSQTISPTTHLTFFHRFATEVDFDGGVLEVSVSGGPWQDVLDAGGVFVTGGYTGQFGDSDFVLSGRQAWTGISDGFETQQMNQVDVDLSALAGQSIRVRYRFGMDQLLGEPGGWWIDDVAFSDLWEEQSCDFGVPVARDDTATVNAGESVNTAVKANDSDDDTPIADLTVTIENAPTHGTATVQGDGTITYEHLGDGATSDVYEYRITDPEGNWDTAFVVVTIVQPENQPPDAVDDEATVNAGESVTIFVRSNDSDPDHANTELTVTVEDGPTHGTAVEGDNGSIIYTHNGNTATSDSFTYRLTDPGGLHDIATVTVTIDQDLNQDPVAEDDTAQVNASDSVVIPVLANDSDPDGDDIFISGIGQGSSGMVTNNGDGTLTYTHGGDAATSDSFTYTISDGRGGSDQATVTVTIDQDGGDTCRNALCENKDKPAELTLTFTGGDCSASNNSQGSKADCEDFAPYGGGSVYIKATDDDKADDDNPKVWFEGTVAQGDAFTLQAALEGKDDFGSKVFIHIWSADPALGGTLLQTVEIHTSCSAPLIEGEQFGGLTLGDPDADPDAPICSAGEGRVHGSGYWERNSGEKYDKIDFSFDAKHYKGALKGKLKVKDKDLDFEIYAKTITSLSRGEGVVCGGLLLDGTNTFAFTAVGKWKDKATDTEGQGEYFACGVDNGKNNELPHDYFYVETVSGTPFAYSTGARTGGDNDIDGGNIHLHDPIVDPVSPQASHRASGQNAIAERHSTSGADASQTRVGFGTPAFDLTNALGELIGEIDTIDLDPLLLDSVPAGTPLVLTAVAEATGGLAAHETMTLRWESASGESGEVESLTSALGVATFTVIVPAGDVDYTVWSGDLSSNGVRISGS